MRRRANRQRRGARRVEFDRAVADAVRMSTTSIERSPATKNAAKAVAAMSETDPTAAFEPDPIAVSQPDATAVTVPDPASDLGMLIVRYGIGAVMVLGGIVLLAIDPAGVGVDGFAMAVGGGLSVLMLNFMFRLSVSSEGDREREEQARVYFDEHGEWPEDEPTRTGRKWVLAPGVVTYEQEQAQLAAQRAAELVAAG
jgi:hypothetical protein